MTRKKRSAPEPPIFTGVEKLDLETFRVEKFDVESYRSCCKPKPSSKSRPAPPPPLPRKMLSARTMTTTASIVIAQDNRPNNSNKKNKNNSLDNNNDEIISQEVDVRPNNNNNNNNRKGQQPVRQIIRRDYFSDDDDFDDLSFDDVTSTTPPPTSKTPTTSTRPSSSGRESPNESICTTDSGVNSDLDLIKNSRRHFSPRNRNGTTTTDQSPTNSIVSQDSLEQNVENDTDAECSNIFTPPLAPPILSEYLSDTPPLFDIRRPSQLDLIQEARRMLKKGIALATPIRSPSPTETIASEWSDESQVIFHINERDDIPPNPIFDENFAGARVLNSEPCSNSSTSTIRSHRGTIRGVKNRVRAGIATFLRDQKAKVICFSFSF